MNTSGYDLSVVMEFLNDITASQEGNRHEYKRIATEAVLGESRTKMIEALYQDIINKSSCDFGKIPESKGVITQLVYYKTMSNSLSNLNKLLEEKPPEELELANKLHDMIIAERGNFVMGYTFDIEIIKTMYCTLVVALIDMINLCILAYADYLKDVKKVEINFRSANRYNLLVINNVKSILKAYKRGEWGKMMISFRKESMNIHNLAVTGAAATALFVVTLSVVAFLSFIAILNAIRHLIYLYYYASVKVADKIDEQITFLKSNIEKEDNEQALDKQQKMLRKLSAIRDYIHIHILKDEQKAREEIKKSDQTQFSKEKIKLPETKDTEDIQFE